MRQVMHLLLLLPIVVPRSHAEDAVFLARDLSAASKNIAAQYAEFGNLTLCVGSGGFMEWAAQVDAGSHHVHFFYASGEPRPCRLSINGRQRPGDVLGDTTGGFHPEHLRWQSYGPIEFRKGKNTIRLSTAGLMPHVKGLVVSSKPTPPDAAVFRDVAQQVAELSKELGRLRGALTYLAERYPANGPQRQMNSARINQLGEALQPGVRLPVASMESLTCQMEQLRREVLVKHNPLMSFDLLLFVKRPTFQSSHYYTDYIDGCQHYGGNLCILRLSDNNVTELAPQLNGGIFGRFDLSFDARRVVFDYKARPETGFRIYEVKVDGTGLRQLTFDPPDEPQQIARYANRGLKEWGGRPLTYRHQTDDVHPCYLPDGGICFVSTRCRFGILCDGPDVFTTTVLYRMDGDGRNLQRLSNSPLSESAPSITNDGRILYTRWEYVDKGDVVIKCLWTMHPDGTRSAEVFGNDVDFPDDFLYGRAVPERSNLFAAIGAPHMPLGVGTVLRLDINRPIRTREPMTYITPDVDVRSEYGFFHRRGGKWVQEDRGPLFADPWPLSDKFFLVAHNPDRPCRDPRAYGIYLLDEFGNCVPVYRDPAVSCWHPVPLRARPRPPVIASVGQAFDSVGQAFDLDRPDDGRTGPSRAHVRPEGLTFMSDVYQGLDGVPRGTIKYLRIMETLPRPWAARRTWDGDERYQQHAVVSMNASLHTKKMHGVVPVEEDGSACFMVPADKNLFFQALDKDYMEVQRMRTFVNFRPGEMRSCIGCHQRRELASPVAPVAAVATVAGPAALHRPPRAPQPQPGDTAACRQIYYPADVQPILDRHCVRCHGPERQDARLDLSGELTELFNRSYESILSRDLVRIVRENDPKTGNASPVPPYTLGSHASRLVTLVRQGHEGVRLSREEFIRLVTWVDSNAQYYGSYFGRRNLKYRGLPDFRP